MSEDTATTNHRKRRYGWLLAAGALVAVVVALALVDRQPGADIEETVTLKFVDVVQTDLVEETEYDGTLGRPAGDSLNAPTQGTVTWLPEPGDTLEVGDAAFEIDGVNVVVIYGDLPQYRTLASSPDTQSVGSVAAGVITSVVEPGELIEQGDVLYEVDGEPVVALYGTAPAYRDLADLSTNITGEDVGQLENALDALGFVSEGEMTVDDEFTGATASVVEQWQEAIGANEDGRVDLGEVVFIDGPSRVLGVQAQVGDRVASGQDVIGLAGPEVMEGEDVRQLQQGLLDLGFDQGGALTASGLFDSPTTEAVLDFETANGLDVDGRIDPGEILFLPEAVRVAETLTTIGSVTNAGAPVLAVTGEQIVVTVNLPAADQGSVSEGMAVIVELPDQTNVAATVTAVASVATVLGNETVFEVEIALDDPSAASGLDEAPVDVKVITDSVEDVIAVPVAALLALAEGGYAVELDSGDGGTRLIAVDPGFFADGLVEVEGDLAAGDRVVIP